MGSLAVPAAANNAGAGVGSALDDEAVEYGLDLAVSGIGLAALEMVIRSVSEVGLAALEIVLMAIFEVVSMTPNEAMDSELGTLILGIIGRVGVTKVSERAWASLFSCLILYVVSLPLRLGPG